jgi:hypothetical protein
MKKWLYISIIIVLGLATIYGIAFSIITKVGEESKIAQAKATGQTRVAEVLASSARQATDLQATMTASAKENSSSLSALESNYQATIEAQNVAAQATLTGIEAENLAKLNMLKTAVQCENATSNINYSDNSTVSLSLKTWLESTQGKISERNWTEIWYNSHTAIHKLVGKNIYEFIVYFDEPALEFTKSIFNISGMCWLDVH